MFGRRFVLFLPWLALVACQRRQVPVGKPSIEGPVVVPGAPAPHMPWDETPVLAAGQTFALKPGGGPMPIADARAAGLLDVDLSDGWAPFILSESDGDGQAKKPHFYRETFIALGNDRVHPDDLLFDGGATRQLPSAAEIAARKELEAQYRRRGKEPPPPKRPQRSGPTRNYLEPFGIPPTLSVLAARIDEDAARTCYGAVDLEGLRAWDGDVTFQDRDQAKREYQQAFSDATWVAQKVAERAAGDAGRGKKVVVPPDAAAPEPADVEALAADPKLAARVKRYQVGQRRLRAVRAVQSRLVCEGLLSPKERFVEGMFDLPTHEALAEFERKNDIFGWGFLGGETLQALLRPVLELHFDTFKRVLTERVVDAAAIIEDGSVSLGRSKPVTYRDQTGQVVPVPNLVESHLNALLDAMAVHAPADMVNVLHAWGAEGRARVHVAFKAPPLPPYYFGDPTKPPQTDAGAQVAPEMDLLAEIDRGDVWYDFPFDGAGKPIEQRREHFPHLTIFVRWNKQKLPLARWRTTIGSWRSEVGEDGHVYYKYKNSDVGPRIWRDIVSAPVWVPPDSTPTKDLLTRKVFDRQKGPQVIVNTEVMGPGFGSAYGLVLAIHHQVTGGGGLFDNQIRTHGSVDYTSIARRFSHGCHRLVNARAVRLFGFVLRHRVFERVGNQPLGMKKRFVAEGKSYGFQLTTRGYLFRLKNPIPVETLEGRIMGGVKKPITAFMRKAGVDYGDRVVAPADEQVAPVEVPPVEAAPVLGP